MIALSACGFGMKPIVKCDDFVFALKTVIYLTWVTRQRFCFYGVIHLHKIEMFSYFFI